MLYRLEQVWSLDRDARSKYKGDSVLQYEIGVGEMRKEWKWIKIILDDNETGGNVKGMSGKGEK